MSALEAEVAELFDAMATGQDAAGERDELRNLCDGLIAENDELRRKAAADTSTDGDSEISSEEDEV